MRHAPVEDYGGVDPRLHRRHARLDLGDHAAGDGAVGAQFGRTMSPVAAVAMMAAAISGTAPTDLIRRVAPALLAGLGVLLLAALLGIV